MSKVIFATGISLDGYMAGKNRGPDNPLGDKGPIIQQWMYQQKAFWEQLGQEGGNEEGADNALIEQMNARTGAYIMGKRMFDEGEVNWPEDLYEADVYVLTHKKRALGPKRRYDILLYKWWNRGGIRKSERKCKG